MIRRREFIAGLGSTAAWPVVARAQQPALPVVALLRTVSADGDEGYVAAFRLAPKRVDGRFDLCVAMNGRNDWHNLACSGSCLQRGQINRCVRRVDEHHYGPLEPGRDLREQLKPLASQRGF